VISPAPAPTEPPTAQGVADLPEVLSLDQAAWMLQVSTRVLDEAARRGEVPSHRLGRRRVYSKSGLLAWFAGEGARQ
jgi:hypothetical protein